MNTNKHAQNAFKVHHLCMLTIFNSISKGKYNFVKDVWRVLYLPFHIISLIDKGIFYVIFHNVSTFHRYQVYWETICSK